MWWQSCCTSACYAKQWNLEWICRMSKCSESSFVTQMWNCKSLLQLNQLLYILYQLHHRFTSQSCRKIWFHSVISKVQIAVGVDKLIKLIYSTILRKLNLVVPNCSATTFRPTDAIMTSLRRSINFLCKYRVCSLLIIAD